MVDRGNGGPREWRAGTMRFTITGVNVIASLPARPPQLIKPRELIFVVTGLVTLSFLRVSFKQEIYSAAF